MTQWPPSEYLSFIPEPEKYIEHLHHPLPPYIRINPIKAPADKIMHLLKDEGVFLKKLPVDFFYKAACGKELGNLLGYHLGYIYPQALTSAMPVIALNPRPGDLILDMCAAPGGKTTHMAQLMGDQGTIVANDRSFGRLTALSANIKRCGITCVVITQYKGEHFPYGEHFDKILLDAPCSGEGKYRIGRDGRLLFSISGRTNLPAIQKGLIVRAFDLLKPGGTLVYSTCTLNPEENEGVVDALLKKRNALVLGWNPPLRWHRGIDHFKGHAYHALVTGCRRFYPHEANSVGFFVAKIVKPKQNG